MANGSQDSTSSLFDSMRSLHSFFFFYTTREDEQLTRKELRNRASGGAMESGARGGVGDELRWTHEQGRSGFPGL